MISAATVQLGTADTRINVNGGVLTLAGTVDGPAICWSTSRPRIPTSTSKGTSAKRTPERSLTINTAGDNNLDLDVNFTLSGTMLVVASTSGVDVIQSAAGAITADKLGVSTNGGDSLLCTGTHDVNVFAATTGTSAGNVTFRDGDELEVGTVGSVSGITTRGGDVALSTAAPAVGAVSLNITQPIQAAAGTIRLRTTAAAPTAIAQTAAGDVLGAALGIQVAGGNVLLTGDDNNVDTLAAPGPRPYPSSTTMGSASPR